MARRIDIELTSTRPDGTWTWRAAGAKEPKGVLAGSLLYDGAKTGDVVRAEAEFEIEGITVISVLPPKADNRREAQRIEIIGTPRQDAPGVTTQLLGRNAARRREGPEGRPGRDARPARERPAGERSAREQDSDQGERARARGERARRDGPPRERRDRRERTGATSGDETGARNEPPHRDPSGGQRARSGPRTEGGAGRSVRPGPGRPGSHEPGAEDRKSKRLNPGHVHRQAVLDSLAPEQRPIAEQVLRGGIPAVRTALHLEREKAEAEGRPAPNTDQLVAMAEELLPRLKTAEWRDRADAVVKDSEAVSLRDLRSVVAGSDVARDEETRTLAATLREALERRVALLHEEWSQEIAKHLDENRVVRALRLSARPPEPLARLGSELSQRLTDAASEALSSDAAPDRWLALLEAAAASPVRRSIKPAGLPSDPGQEIKQAAFQQSGRIPALAVMLGVSIPPPPTPAARRSRPSPGPRTHTRRPPAPRPASPQSSEPPPEPVEGGTDSPNPQDSSNGTTAPVEPAGSAESREDPPIVEELGEPLDQPQVGDLG